MGRSQGVLNLEQWMEIQLLHKQGLSIRAISEATGHSRNTVRRYLRDKQPPSFSATPRDQLLDDYQEYVKNRYQECALSAVRILAEIRPMGYRGSVQTLRRFLATLKPARQARRKLTVRFETPPGQQGQADWATCGRFADASGRIVPVYAFVMVLSFSRMLFIKFVTSMDLPTLLGCHQEAFGYFGGWPASILYDNMKQVKLDKERWNPLLVDFAAHHGFVPKTHAIRRPRTKGKVERMVHYLKDNFLNGRSFGDLQDLSAQGLHWIDQVANVRVHATTGKRPVDLLASESLTALSAVSPYRVAAREVRKVDAESMVRFGRSRYSVPPEHVGQEVLVVQEGLRIVIRSAELILAEHAVATKAGSCVTAPEHVADLWKRTLGRSPEPAPRWNLTFDQAVAATPLSCYEEAGV
jgi:transposase